MVSIRKLAQLAGVSHMTVWSALHDKPGVSPEVRARILALAEEYHYHPNRLVEGLIYRENAHHRPHCRAFDLAFPRTRVRRGSSMRHSTIRCM